MRDIGRLAERPRSRHPCLTSRRQDRAIRLAHMRIRLLAATKTGHYTTGTHNRPISPKTVQNRFRDSGRRSCCPYASPPLTLSVVSYGVVNSICTQAISNKAEETSPFKRGVSLHSLSPDSSCRVYRRRGEHFADAFVGERGFIGGCIIVWGGIAHGVQSQLVVVESNMTTVRYRDEILRPAAVPLVQQHQLILQKENARPHVARVCRNFLANNNIIPLEWPPLSPDLSPTENLWDDLAPRL